MQACQAKFFIVRLIEKVHSDVAEKLLP
jgi:hypothetical protein